MKSQFRASSFITLFGSVFLSFCSYAASAREYTRAGAIICSAPDGLVQVLLSSESKTSGWTNFVGGRKDKADKGDPVNTAIREAHEESKCHFTEEKLKSGMMNGKINPLVEEFVGYPLFIVRLDKLDKPPLKKAPTDCQDPEKKHFHWETISNIEKAIADDSVLGSPPQKISSKARGDFTSDVIERIKDICSSSIVNE